MYCPQCGTPLLDNSSFCRTCSSVVEPLVENPNLDLDEDGDLTPIGKHGVIDKKRKDLEGEEGEEHEEYASMVPSKPPTAETAAARANTIGVRKGVLIAVGAAVAIVALIVVIVFVVKPGSTQPANTTSASSEAAQAAESSSSADSSDSSSLSSSSAASDDSASAASQEAAEPLPSQQASEYNIPTTTPVTDPFFGVWILSTRSEQEATAAAHEATGKGLYGTVFVAAEWSNLKPDPKYLVAAGYSHNEGEANTLCEKAKRAGYENAYVQYSGDYKG